MSSRTPKPESARRRLIGSVILITLALLIAALWLSSRSRIFMFEWGQPRLWLYHGQLRCWLDTRISRPFHIDAEIVVTPGTVWWPLVGYEKAINPASFNCLTFAVWPVPLLLTAPGAWLLRSGLTLRRQARAFTCHACGYDLRGLVSPSTCPECGKPVTLPVDQRMHPLKN